MSEPGAVVNRGTSPPPPGGPPTELDFTVLGVEPLAHSVVPTLRFHLHVTEPDAREIYTIALSAQIHIDPARRAYDAETRERLVELFGAPERWGATTHSFQWAFVEKLVPSFCGSTTFAVEVPCTYDLEVAASKYFSSLPDGEVPLSFHFNGTVMYCGAEDRLQVVLVPWSCSTRYGMPADAWKRAIAAHYPNGGWIRLGDEALERLGRHKAERGLHSFDLTVLDLLEGRG